MSSNLKSELFLVLHRKLENIEQQEEKVGKTSQIFSEYTNTLNHFCLERSATDSSGPNEGEEQGPGHYQQRRERESQMSRGEGGGGWRDH